MSAVVHPLHRFIRPSVTGTTNCPGCGNGIAAQAILRAMDELSLTMDDFVFVSGIGCSAWIPSPYFNADVLHTTHGRPIAFALGIKMGLPEKKVMVVSGDGDLTAIGGNHLIHNARRNVDMIVICLNNGIYGMTGGQMAPTTLPGMRSSTSPYGRDVAMMGHPLKMTELVAHLPGVNYVTRQAVHTPGNVRKTKKALRKAFEIQKEGKGLSFVEVVSNCNSGWKMTPVQSNKWMEENMFPFYPLGDIKVDGKLVEPKQEPEKE